MSVSDPSALVTSFSGEPRSASAVLEGEPEVTARLGLLIGEHRWLVDLAEAGEIVPAPDGIAPVPLTRDWLLGLVNLRGALYTVVDLLRFAQWGQTELTKESRLLALADRLDFNAAILVSRMLGLRSLSAMRPLELASDARAAATPDWIGRTLIDAEGHPWRELKLARLAAGGEFLRVGR